MFMSLDKSLVDRLFIDFDKRRVVESGRGALSI